MATIPSALIANDTSNDQKNAIRSSANAQFIDDVSNFIAISEKQGQFRVNLNIPPNVVANEIQTYFENLGYIVSYQSVWNPANQPSQLFGFFWVDYWNSTLAHGGPVPVRMTISWENV